MAVVPSKENFTSHHKGFFASFHHLFFAVRFRIHRLWGLVYLWQFAMVCILEVRGTPDWKLYVTMPLTGIIQSIIACRTFTFLPAAKEETQGYYHETRVMSYDFILENIYFAGLLLFQSCYVVFNKSMRTHIAFLPIELIGTFFPYHTIRGYFPKSSFRHSTKDGKNRFASVTKFFYVTAKHFSGYYVNYMCFLGMLGDNPIQEWSVTRRLFILGGWGTTIAMFLQTLKFKKYISARTAMLLYTGSFPLFWSIYAVLFATCMEHMWLTALTLVGVAVNFGSWHGQLAYQSLVCAVCLAVRFGWMQSSMFSQVEL